MDVDKYRILERIGIGGMAEVYRAEMVGAEGFRKPVAVKRLLPELTGDQDLIQRFVDEAHILSGLNHPNIVQVHDFERHADEYLLIMEYVHGRSLAELLQRCEERRQMLAPGMIAHIAAEAAAGLGHAHALHDEAGRPLNIVHRDVTPQNILISRDGQVKVTDFGIAKVAFKSSRTQVGMLKGKLSYLAPEQVWGKDAEPRSDIFSLGVVIYLMATGHKLFTRKSDMETFEAVRHWTGLSEDTRPARIPGRLWNILKRALEPDAEKRFQDAAELSRKFRAYSLELSDRPQGTDLGKLMGRLFGEEMSTPIGTHRDARSLATVLGTPAEAAEVAQPTRLTLPEGAQGRGRRWWLPTVLSGVLLGALGAVWLVDWKGSPGPSVVADAAVAPDGTGRLGGADGADAGVPPVVAGAPDGGTVPVRPDTRRPPVRKRSGTLVLSSDPWAYVEVDGKRLREPTPIPGLKLRPGTYKIRLFNPDAGLSKTIRVRIRSGKVTRRVVRF